MPSRSRSVAHLSPVKSRTDNGSFFVSVGAAMTRSVLIAALASRAAKEQHQRHPRSADYKEHYACRHRFRTQLTLYSGADHDTKFFVRYGW
jgi:hypothetical protein